MTAPIADFGPQPITNRFRPAEDLDDRRYRLALFVCAGCGLVQLHDPPPAGALTPEVDWVAHREPDVHLDALAERVAGTAALAGGGAVGLGDHDAPLLQRLERHGLTVTAIDWRAELGPVPPHAGTETLQERLTPATARELAARCGRSDLLVARSLIEHAHDLPCLLAAVRELIRPRGLLLVETPDSEPALDRLDPSVIWEEHTFYFTEATLRSALAAAGFSPLWATRPAGTTELVMLAAAQDDPASSVAADASSELRRARGFANGLGVMRRRWTELLDAELDAGREVALFGAGHAGAAFVNLLGLGDRLSCAIDDHPMKRGAALPGSNLEIVPSSELGAAGIGGCLMALSPEAERRVASSTRDWQAAGGRLLSVSPWSPRYPFSGARA